MGCILKRPDKSKNGSFTETGANTRLKLHIVLHAAGYTAAAVARRSRGYGRKAPSPSIRNGPCATRAAAGDRQRKHSIFGAHSGILSLRGRYAHHPM